MKTINILLIIITSLTFMFQSCDLELPDNQIERLKWSYDFEQVSFHSIINTIPAIDEDGNIYISGELHNQHQIGKLNSSGEEIWSINDNTTSRIIYNDKKLFYLKSRGIICLNANNGSKLWETSNKTSFDIFALSSNRIYTTRFEEGGIIGANYIDAFDLDGNKIWETRIRFSDEDTISFPYTLSVKDKDLYIAVLAEVNDSEFGIINLKDEGNYISQKWSWLAPEDFETTTSARLSDIAIDDDGNLLFGLKNSNENYIFSVNSNGTENWHVKTDLTKDISNVTVDKNGYAYVSYDKCQKIGQEGIVWSSKFKDNWEFEGLISKGPVITADNNFISSNFSKILSFTDLDGNLDWTQYYDPIQENGTLKDEEFHQLTINRNGDIIIITKFGVKCFKGDGTGLSNFGWPKIYGNYGNTGSRK